MILRLLARSRPHSAFRTPHSALVRLAQLMLMGVLMGGAAVAQAQTPTGGSVAVQITRPQAGEQVTSTKILVTLATTGTVALSAPGASEWPGPGLFHVLLDGVDVLQTPQLQFSIQPVTPGPHTLRVELQDWTGTATPAQVAFTVAPAPLTGGTWWLAGTVAALGVVLLGSLSLLWLRWVRPVQTGPADADEETDEASPVRQEEEFPTD